ncbi:competence type IV pilus minor pilin ComGG [Alkalicoccobacillus porphyridii]|uniref:Competence protein ComG n=1 Tax=Alkalicoccobacillus porphyridii TaxID=2597270 RepID=A0A553ZTD3_9BACI|nr:competence type IV pilus minor pilin ComGG [Alkalicoccobacillus porphyridii]TSB44722.1 hypothetical protein FN960_20005 [Alkalicoccobacillus porphyridii]
MSRQEGGFAYPMTMLIVSLLTLACLYAMQLYETEKRYVLEQEKLLQLNNLVQISIQDYIDLSEKQEGTEVMEYEIGTVTLITRTQSEEVVLVDIRAAIQESHKRRARMQVNVTTNQIIQFSDMT